MTRLKECIATFCYVGRLPFVPGTMGSLAALPLLFFCSHTWFHAALIVVIFFFGKIAADHVIRTTQIADPQQIVIDEVCGILITFFLHPLNLSVLVGGFLLFRIFDILKPFPARQSESLPGGWGVMVDDVIAGIYANLTLFILGYFI